MEEEIKGQGLPVGEGRGPRRAERSRRHEEGKGRGEHSQEGMG